MMRQHPSLDVIAAQRARRLQLADVDMAQPAVDVGGDAHAGTSAAAAQSDSRSTSSASSPAPADNEESDFFLAPNDSQSSLGVPNLQDMQVSDDDCIPPIHRLPNEILISIFSKLSHPADLLRCMLTCRRWARNAVDILWHRPSCTNWQRHASICQTLGQENPTFAYRDFIKRLNMAALADKVNDGSVMPLTVCTRVERLTLTNCKGLTDTGLIGLVQNNSHLLALDISNDEQITEASIFAIAENCRRLQGLNVSGCVRISNESMIKLAENCRFLKRLKLNDCRQLTDEAILAFAEHCPNILEIDLHQCRLLGNEPVTALLTKGQCLRELRLANCELIDDSAFLSLPANRTYEHLRILDLTSCVRLTDRAVEKIVDVAPRLRNVVLAKCRNLTDAAVFAISRLGKNLHFIHLGHCGNITDEAVKRLVQCCNRIRYIDLGCCVNLTDQSVTRLATLPKLKRIGLVKCANITDASVDALARANQRIRQRRDADGNIIPGEHYTSSHSSLERVHLSYCTSLTLKSIIGLLNACPRLTHLSLTGVQAFLRDDLEQFCRDAPPEFNEHQRQVFCVFSGQGVINLRRHLNTDPAFAHFREPTFGEVRPRAVHAGVQGGQANGAAFAAPGQTHGDAAFDEGEPDVIEDDDGLDGSEMTVDAQPLLVNPVHLHSAPGAVGAAGAAAQAGIPPPPPPAPAPPGDTSANRGDAFATVLQGGQFSGDGMTELPPVATNTAASNEAMLNAHAVQNNAAGPSVQGASTAAIGLGQAGLHPFHQSSTSLHASVAGPASSASGASTASPHGLGLAGNAGTSTTLEALLVQTAAHAEAGSYPGGGPDTNLPLD
ncbi:hypothetical protein VTK73DRAFT_6260 [Phialemonium thermophilum]|uniref:F-box domain-containing protein n=1 Tax=Phialemonium thermophilum TaxID=223376 RepID=A0ABR3WK63_9PEZI